MKLTIKKGTTSKLAHIFVSATSKADGSGLTGLVYNTASLTAYYIRPGAASATVISLVTATVGTFASGGFKEIDATNLPGIYEIGIPNACLASGAESCTIMLKGAADMAPLPIEIQLETNTNASVGEIRAELEGAGYTLATILADTGELQNDWKNGGRLDLLIDAILLDTSTTIDDKVDAITTALETHDQNIKAITFAEY